MKVTGPCFFYFKSCSSLLNEKTYSDPLGSNQRHSELLIASSLELLRNQNFYTNVRNSTKESPYLSISQGCIRFQKRLLLIHQAFCDRLILRSLVFQRLCGHEALWVKTAEAQSKVKLLWMKQWSKSRGLKPATTIYLPLPPWWHLRGLPYNTLNSPEHSLKTTAPDSNMFDLNGIPIFSVPPLSTVHVQLMLNILRNTVCELRKVQEDRHVFDPRNDHGLKVVSSEPRLTALHSRWISSDS